MSTCNHILKPGQLNTTKKLLSRGTKLKSQKSLVQDNTFLYNVSPTTTRFLQHEKVSFKSEESGSYSTVVADVYESLSSGERMLQSFL